MEEPRHYRKKPVVIQAIQWTGDNAEAVLAFTGPGGFDAGNPDHNYEGVAIAKLWVAANRAWLDLDKGEWVLKDSVGFYPCKAEVFATTYDLAEDPA